MRVTPYVNKSMQGRFGPRARQDRHDDLGHKNPLPIDVKRHCMGNPKVLING